MVSVVTFDNEDFAVRDESADSSEHPLRRWASLSLRLLLLGTLTPVVASVALVTAVLGKSFSSRLSAFVIPHVMGLLDSRLRDVRKECLKSIHGKVIDVGCAHGGYLSYYSSNAERLRRIVMLEPNVHHNRRLQENINRCRAQNPRMKDVEIVVENRFLEDLPASEDGTFDWVVLGNVMCEIPFPSAAVRELDRLLRRGGRVYFCEHIAHEQGTWMRFAQDVLNPWWYRASDGCNINRCTVHTLQSMGWRLQYWSFMRQSIAPMVVGIAVKDS